MSFNNNIHRLRKICPYHKDNIHSSDDYSGLHSVRYLDSDDVCNDLMYLNEYRDSDGHILEFFDNDAEDSNEMWIMMMLLMIICLVCI